MRALARNLSLTGCGEAVEEENFGAYLRKHCVSMYFLVEKSPARVLSGLHCNVAFAIESRSLAIPIRTMPADTNRARHRKTKLVVVFTF